MSTIACDHVFSDPELLERALTHRSYIRENGLDYDRCNERLEFLGDSLLNMFCAEYLIRRFPDHEEGALSKLRALVVCEEALNIVAQSLQIGPALRLGRGEEHNGGRRRPSILADAVEACIAAVYLDGGTEQARDMVMRYIPELVDRAEAGLLRHADHKTVLQELVQSRSGLTLSYAVLSQRGPDHDKIFEAGAYLNGTLCARGEGRTKKDAQQAAAAQLLDRLKKDQTLLSEVETCI